MRRRRMSQSELSLLTGITQGTLSRILSGKTLNPRAEAKQALERVLGVPADSWPRVPTAATRRSLRRAMRHAKQTESTLEAAA